jgi:hypothetical protein
VQLHNKRWYKNINHKACIRFSGKRTAFAEDDATRLSPAN